MATTRRNEVREDHSLDGIPSEFRAMIEEAERRCAAAGVPVLRFETKRTLARQQFLAGKGRTAGQCAALGVPVEYAWPSCPDGIVTKAPSNYRTWHGAFVAVDWIHPTLRWGTPRVPVPEIWKRTVAGIVRPLGFTWGGLWPSLPDWPHFQHAALPIGPRAADKLDIQRDTLAAIWRRYLIAA